MAELLNENDLSQVSGGAYSGPVSEYTIKEGDTLGVIAKRHATTEANLLELNPQIKNKNRLFPGTVIKIPTTRNC